MPIFLCTACGTSYPPRGEPPPRCPVCDDERQFVPASGQGWTTREALARTHRNAWRQHEPNVLSLHTAPHFGIGQRAILLRTPAGNILWDCVALLDPATEAVVHGLGGLAAIAVSHPHYYTTVQDWAAAFGAPVHLHALDRDWVMRPDPALRFWDGDRLAVAPDVTLVRAGGHFPGGTVLHWTGSHDGRGVLLAGDIVQIAPGAKRVSFMWSYPNMMPLPADEIAAIEARLAPYPYDRIYGAFDEQDVPGDGAAIVARSAARYRALLQGGAPVAPPPEPI